MIKEPLIKKVTWTNWFLRSRLIIIPIVPLHIPWSIKELLRNIIRVLGCNLTEVGRLVLVLKIDSASDRSHWVESMKSMDWKIRNFSSETGSMLQIILLICWAVFLNLTILVVLRRVLISDQVRNSKCLYWRVCQVWKEILPIQISCNIW